jgi:hypothetical protein
VSSDDQLGPCDCFTVLETHKGQNVQQCEVCDHLQAEHEGTGIRISTGGEIEALRRRILIERYERRQQEDPRKPDPTSELRTNGDPELH